LVGTHGHRAGPGAGASSTPSGKRRAGGRSSGQVDHRATVVGGTAICSAVNSCRTAGYGSTPRTVVADAQSEGRRGTGNRDTLGGRAAKRIGVGAGKGYGVSVWGGVSMLRRDTWRINGGVRWRTVIPIDNQ
jgi:hypothetical protein